MNGTFATVSKTGYTPVQEWERPAWLKQLAQDKAVSAWWEKVGPVVTRLQEVPTRIMNVLKTLRDQLHALALDETLTGVAKHEKTLALRNVALTQIDAIYQDALADAQTLERRIDEATAEQPGEPAAELLKELQLQRAWQRAQGLLDSLSDPGSVQRQADDLAQNAAKDGDRAMLAALRQELPAYLQARKLVGPVEGVLARLAELEAPHLPPLARAGRQLEQQAQAGWQRLVAAIEQARREVSGQSKTVVLPGWGPNESLEF